MEEKLTRDEIQQQAIDTFRKSKRLILNWGTGVGKSRVAVKSMEELAIKNPDAKILLMVQETPHKDNWKNEIRAACDEVIAERIIRMTVIDCYASLKKHKDSSWDLIVFDEGHHLRSSMRQAIVMTMKSERVLILTATISDNGDGDLMMKTLFITFGEFKVLKLGLQNAINNEILGKPEIHVIPVVLDDDRGQKYDKLTEYQEQKKKDYFTRRGELGMSYNSADNAETEELKAKWLNAGSRRKKMLGHSKTTVARRLLRGPLKNKKFICFSTSLEQIEWLNGENYVSSKNTAKQNKENIEAFNRGEKTSLFAMGMLQEGQNLSGIEAGLIVQLDGKARPFIQKFGRVMRAKTPILYILYVMHTNDEEYLSKALSGIDKQFIIKESPVWPNGEPAPAIVPSYGKAVTTQTVIIEKESFSERPTEGYKWEVDQREAKFVNIKGVSTDTLYGYLKSIRTVGSPFSPEFEITLEDRVNNVEQKIVLNKKLSLSLISSLLSVTKIKDKEVTINTVSKNGWANYNVYIGKQKVRWSNEDREAYKNANDKVAFIDTLAKRLQNNIEGV